MDFNWVDIFTIKKVVVIAKWFKAKIRIVHRYTVEESIGKEQLEWFKEMVGQNINYHKYDFMHFWLMARTMNYENLPIYPTLIDHSK